MGYGAIDVMLGDLSRGPLRQDRVDSRLRDDDEDRVIWKFAGTGGPAMSGRDPGGGGGARQKPVPSHLN